MFMYEHISRVLYVLLHLYYMNVHIYIVYERMSIKMIFSVSIECIFISFLIRPSIFKGIIFIFAPILLLYIIRYKKIIVN